VTNSIILFFIALTFVARGAELVVAAASDLAPLGPAITAGFARETGHTLRFTFGSSGSLARQIENGAPYDVFLAASDIYARDLAAQGHVGTGVIYAFGRVALWSADGAVRELGDLNKTQVRHVAMANPAHAPYGAAAKQVLERQGFWTSVEPKLVYGENVRQALQFAESRNADAVLTSWTLLKGRGVLLPAEWHDPIRQTGAVVRSSRAPDAAAALLRFLTSSTGQGILSSGGLTPLPVPTVRRPASPSKAQKTKRK
jgi:molybdate transport system substrate-binding protein